MPMDDDEELVVERIEAFDITFSRPEFWSFRREHDETYLYWDEDAGSMRVTPLRVTVDIERYLTSVFEEERVVRYSGQVVGGESQDTGQKKQCGRSLHDQ